MVGTPARDLLQFFSEAKTFHYKWKKLFANRLEGWALEQLLHSLLHVAIKKVLALPYLLNQTVDKVANGFDVLNVKRQSRPDFVAGSGCRVTLSRQIETGEACSGTDATDFKRVPAGRSSLHSLRSWRISAEPRVPELPNINRSCAYLAEPVHVELSHE